jgi:hypothetical protein
VNFLIHEDIDYPPLYLDQHVEESMENLNVLNIIHAPQQHSPVVQVKQSNKLIQYRQNKNEQASKLNYHSKQQSLQEMPIHHSLQLLEKSQRDLNHQPAYLFQPQLYPASKHAPQHYY